MLADPAFQAAKVEATHPLSHTESVTAKGEQTEIVTSRVISTEEFPDFAKSMIGPKLRVTETLIWSRASADGSRTGTIAITIGDAPIAMNGTVRLAPGGLGTRIDVDGDLKAKIPLLGGKVEKAAEGPDPRRHREGAGGRHRLAGGLTPHASVGWRYIRAS